jgi:hypothetical protein
MADLFLLWALKFHNNKKIITKKITMGSALGHGLWAFIKHYIFKQGFRDGWAGFVIAFGNFEGTFYRYAKALEMQKSLDWKTPENFNSPPKK